MIINIIYIAKHKNTCQQIFDNDYHFCYYYNLPQLPLLRLNHKILEAVHLQPQIIFSDFDV